MARNFAQGLRSTRLADPSRPEGHASGVRSPSGVRRLAGGGDLRRFGGGRDMRRFGGGRWLDVVLALALVVAGEAELLLREGVDGRAVAAAVVPIVALPLVWRRRIPLLPLWVATAVLPVQGALVGFGDGPPVAVLVAVVLALYSAGRYAAGARELVAAAVAVAALVATRFAFDPEVVRAGDVVLTFVALSLPLLVGRWVRGQTLLQRELRETAEQVARERERAAREAAEEERMRIATDVQAAIAGSLRVIVERAHDLHARLVSGDRTGAREQLAEMATTARETLADVRRVLGVLRRDGQPRRLAPPAPVIPAPPDRAADGPSSPGAAADGSSSPGAAADGPSSPGAAADHPVPSGPDAGRAQSSPSRRARALDWTLVAVVLVGAQVELADATSGDPVAALTGVAIAVPLLWRRAWPVPVGLAVLTAVAVQSALLDLDPFPVCDIAALTCAAYAIGAHGERRAAVGGLVALALGTTVHAAIVHPDAVAQALLGGTAVPWTVGRIVRSNRRLTGEERERTAQAERSRARRAQAAVTSERMRVARELHDAVAHNISVIAIQAAGADGIVERDPERAAQCAALIESVGREALTELDRLRGPHAAADGAQRPGLARLQELARRTSDGGLPVEVHVEGEPVTLPAGLDLAAFRIVQEALANASKHAGRARADVVLRYRPHTIELEIADDGHGPDGAPPAPTGSGQGRNGPTPATTGSGHGPTPATTGSGHGLIGMRERVALYGGTLRVGERPGGGFAVHATLPRERA